MIDVVFLKAFLKNWREVGWPVPSSRQVARKICSEINFGEAREIFEIGPGTGILTRELLKYLHPDATLSVFEVNPEFCEVLGTIGDPRLRVFNVSALQIHLRQFDCNLADYVVSAVPLTLMPKDMFSKFHQMIRTILRPQGWYIQIQLAPFPTSNFAAVLRNFGWELALEAFFRYLYTAAGTRTGSPRSPGCAKAWDG
jgi:phospholipid N-methyltransferase